MPRIKNRDMQIPGGYSFYVPQTKWRPPRFASFDTIVRLLIAHRQGNPRLAAKFAWSTDYNTVANEVDAFNAAICQQQGWSQYIDSGVAQPAVSSFPLPPQSPLQRLGAVAGGAKTLVNWIASGAEAVPVELAERRAAICADCPKNDKGDWTRFFSVPTSNAIRAALEARKGMNLSTSLDDRLNVCTACGCPLKLKIHMPLERILKETDAQTIAAFDPRCWITKTND